MRIVQIIPDLCLAGAEIMCENLSRELVKQGCDVIVVSLTNQKTAITERLEKDGVQVLFLNKKSGLDFTVIQKLRGILRELRPDAIHTHRHVLQYVVPASGKKVKVVHTVHSVAEHEAIWPLRKLNFLFFHLFGVVPVSISGEVQKTVATEYRMSTGKTPVIVNGIDLSRCIVKSSYKLSPSRIELVHVGRFAEAKNHEALIHAFQLTHKKYPRARLTLLGTGNREDAIRLLAEKLGLSDCVRFLGAQPDVYGYLSEADVFLLPSLYEGMPMSLIEAMGTGLPIVTSRVGGIPDMLVDHESALFVEPADPESISSGICAFLEDSELRAACGKAAKRRAVRFSAKNMAEQYLCAYRS